MAITNATLATAVNDLIAYWASFNEEYAAWIGGTVGGGPNLDGDYPLTNYEGITTLVACPAQLEDDVTNLVTGAAGHKTAAEVAQTAAEVAQAAAELAETGSGAARDAALVYRDAALAAQSAAESARTTSIAQAGVATANAGYSQEWAITIEDTLVSVAAGGNGTTDYSSLHHAAKASASAAAASTSETNAGTSETNAATSETNADLERQYAAEWANKAEGVLVSSAAGGDLVDDYSAFHWAQKAEDFAAAADLLSTANEIITGNWSFDHASGLNIGAGIITAAKITNWDTAYGWGDHGAAGYGVLASNEQMTGRWWSTAPSVGGVQGSSMGIQSSNPQFSFEDTGQLLNEKVWNLLATTNGSFKIRTLADDYATAVDAMAINRTGTAIDGFEFATNIAINGDGEFLTLKNTNHLQTDVLLNSWIQWKDSAATEMAWMGFGDATHNDFEIRSQQSGSNLRLGATGAGDVLMGLGATGGLVITGSSYKTNPTGLRLGQYTATRVYAQAPAGGQFEVWDDETNALATFKNDGHVDFANNITAGGNIYGVHTGFTGAMSIDYSGSHITLRESDGADPADRAIIEVNGGNFNLYTHDTTPGTWYLPFRASLTTGEIWIGQNGTTTNVQGTAKVPNGSLELGVYGTTVGGSLKIDGTTINKQSELICTNGNLHIDSNDGQYIYLNYYSNTAGTYVSANGGFRSTGQFTGTYGAVALLGSKGGYGGVSLDNYFVLMNSGSSHVGLYDDVNNEWMWLAYPNSYIRFYHNGTSVLQTTADGARHSTQGSYYHNASSSYLSGQVTFSTGAATGGTSGDIWYQYT